MLLGHDLHHRFAGERLRLFLTGHLFMYYTAGVLLPLGMYAFVLRSGWLLVIVMVCAAHCVVLVTALWLARRRRHQQAVTLVCIGNWVSVSLITFVAPALLPAMALLALVPVVFAEPYIRWQRGLLFTVINAGCVLGLGALARFQDVSHLGAHTPRAIESAIIIGALPIHALHILVIVWNNAAALRSTAQVAQRNAAAVKASEKLLAERAAQLSASRARLITAADDERRRIERDLHDGAQQYLVALALLIQLARNAAPDRCESLLGEASQLLETTMAEIRRLAHGIYPPLLVSGGLAEALPAAAAHASIPVRVDLQGVDRYPASVEAAVYYCCTEALQNSAKHGGAETTATISAQADEQVLTVTISDTGRGFDPATIGTGLTNMTDRIAAVGGLLTIDTSPGCGTRIIATVPTVKLPGDSAAVGSTADRGAPDHALR